jgi:hypothetical protein
MLAGWRYMALAICAAIPLSGCGSASAPSSRSLPLAAHTRILETGRGAGPPDNTSYPGQYRYMFIAKNGVSSSQLMVQEAARLPAAGWRHVTTWGTTVVQTPRGPALQHVPLGTPGFHTALASSVASLSVGFAMVNNLSDAEGQSEGDTGLSITRAVRQAVGHDGILFVTLASSKL